MTDVLAESSTDAEQTQPHDEAALASWGARAGALGIDVLFGLALIGTLALLGWSAPLFGWLWWVYIGLAVLTGLAVMANRWVLPARTGWTVGRAVTGIRVLRADGTPAGAGRLLARDLAHLLDTAAVFLGWLWPLWDRRHRTFADLLLRTEVRRVGEPERDLRRPVAIGLATAALVCAAATAAGYLVVYRHEQALDAARTEISAQGARIVEQILSYAPQTAEQDFARAQSLAADDYRPQLVEQQEALRKAPLVANEYWTVNSAVLEQPELTPDTASMLLAMQGQRGNDPNTMRFITATVRVDFVKTGDRWQVRNLSVLTRPYTSTAQAGGGR
ncbi:RDD family protein [Mycobacterium sp. AMU20-3851]|uniref:RDD family protein n=1 Tax=Mycobacterium sp. AMU20-3851 TaxID=3122055 RepID=UPI0037548E16